MGREVLLGTWDILFHDKDSLFTNCVISSKEQQQGPSPKVTTPIEGWCKLRTPGYGVGYGRPMRAELNLAGGVHLGCHCQPQSSHSKCGLTQSGNSSEIRGIVIRRIGRRHEEQNG